MWNTHWYSLIEPRPNRLGRTYSIFYTISLGLTVSLAHRKRPNLSLYFLRYKDHRKCDWQAIHEPRLSGPSSRLFFPIPFFLTIRSTTRVIRLSIDFRNGLHCEVLIILVALRSQLTWPSELWSLRMHSQRLMRWRWRPEPKMVCGTPTHQTGRSEPRSHLVGEGTKGTGLR